MKVLFNTTNNKCSNGQSGSIKNKHLSDVKFAQEYSLSKDSGWKLFDNSYRCEVSFSGNIFDEVSDMSFFNDNDADFFSINFFNQLYDNLRKYKINLPPEVSTYLTDSAAANRLESANNVTVTNDASANDVKGLFVDLGDRAKVKNTEAIKNFYMFDNSVSGTAKADRIFLSDNSYSSNNTARIIWVKDSASADKINADTLYQRNASSVAEALTKNFYTRDNAFSKNINSENIFLKDNAYIENAESTSGYIELQDNSHINSLTVNNSKIQLGKNTRIDKIISEGTLDISGSGTVGDIEISGSHAYIRGNINLNGKIKFLNDGGVVIVQKGIQNIFPKLNSSMVENGLLQFLIQSSKDVYLGNPVDTFSPGIRLLSDSVKNYSEQNLPVLKNSLPEVINSFDVETRNLYAEFFHSYLQSLTKTDDSKKFSLFWVNNAKIGDKNLADLWISMLGKGADKLSDTQKTYILNNLSNDEKGYLLKSTSMYWVQNVLPKQQNKIHFDDLNTIKEEVELIKSYIHEIQNSPENFALELDNKEFLDKLLSTEIAGENLLDFWLKEYPLPKAALQTIRLKKEYLKNLIGRQDFADRIVTKTQKAIENQTITLEKYNMACEDLAKNEPDLDKLQQRLLGKYKNSSLFYKIVTGETDNSKSVTEIESEIVKVLKILARERNGLAITARREIFDKTLNLANVVTSKPNTELNNFVNFVFETLSQITPSLTSEDMMDFSDRICAFEKYVNKNSYYLGNFWQAFVKDAYSYYNKVLLDRITDNNLNLLYSIKLNTRQNTVSPMTSFIEDKLLDTIEQRDFVARFQNDYNFQVLMANNGINHKAVLSDLLLTESINENLYQTRLSNFPNDINKNTVKNNLDIADKYLRIQDKDYPVMSISEKTNIISKIPPEEFLYMNKLIMQEWKSNELRSFMSEKFKQTQLMYNINAQSKNIVDSLEKINSNLDNIRVNIAGQSYTLNEMAANLDKLVDIEKKSFKELYFIGENIEAVNHNTKSIRDNTRGILYSAMQNAKMRDPELSKTIAELLPEAERESFTDFLTCVEKKYKTLKDEKKKQQIKMLAQLVAVGAAAAGISGISPDVIAGFFGGGSLASTFSSGLLSVADTLKHVAIFKAATNGMKKT